MQAAGDCGATHDAGALDRHGARLEDLRAASEHAHLDVGQAASESSEDVASVTSTDDCKNERVGS